MMSGAFISSLISKMPRPIAQSLMLNAGTANPCLLATSNSVFPVNNMNAPWLGEVVERRVRTTLVGRLGQLLTEPASCRR